jgi:DNA polymerase-3 subunit delta'
MLSVVSTTSNTNNSGKIFGHEKIEKILANAIKTKKIFPTWVFCGPFGVGKSSVAFKFAKILLSGQTECDDSLTIDPNDPVNNLVEMRIHPDFFVLEQSNESVSIDDIRDLLQKIRKTPAISKWRVVIIENASHLSKNIYNSLLKILEEPPKDTVIIIICNNVGFIPKTLLSRVYNIHFKPLDNSIVKIALDNMQIEDSEALARISNGSVGYALFLKNYNGVEIFNRLLDAFKYSPDGNIYKKSLQYLIDNNLTENFTIIKESLIQILSMYISTLTAMIDQKECDHAVSIFQSIIKEKELHMDTETKKVMEIISMLYKCESLMLDKNAVLVYVFEKFFRFN